jgi:Icc-related predicted phosphoesterase
MSYKSFKSQTFTIEDEFLGPAPSYLLDHLSFSSVLAESILPLTNSSYTPSGFNVPINENNPGQYFWWLYPQQIRLSWTEKEQEMRVTWVTFLNQRQQLAYRGILCTSMGSNSTWLFLDSSTTEFDEGEYTVRIQYIHTVIIKGLDKTCSYEYSVGSTCFWSSLYTFQGKTHYITANPISINEEVSVIITGDWGGGKLGTYTSELMEKDLRSNHYDCVFHLGDFAYDLNDREGRQGDDWLNMIQGISARLPYFGVPGNHEVDYNMSHYNSRFKFPANEANEGLGWFYSMNFGPVHFIVFNTEQYFEDGLVESIKTHKNWLVEDLKKVNKTRDLIPWVIFLTHHSFYCSVGKKECYKQANVLKKDLEEILFEYSVDLVLQGHVHNYERDHAVYKGLVDDRLSDDGRIYLNPRSPVYVINGNAGNYHGHNDPFQKDLPSYFICGSEDFGYGRLKVLNSSHLFYQQFSSETQNEIDYFWIVKDR